MSTKDTSTQAWTPGPWAVHTSNMTTVNSPDGQAVAQPLWLFRRDMNDAEFMANAALIAAAPLLYEALELALKGLEVAAETSPERDDEAWFGYVLAHQKARAALAAARGEQA